MKKINNFLKECIELEAHLIRLKMKYVLDKIQETVLDKTITSLEDVIDYTYMFVARQEKGKKK